jgi:thiol:disulfide interchange protein DsbD
VGHLPDHAQAVVPRILRWRRPGGGRDIGLSPGPIKWTYYTPDRLASAQRDGKVVVLEFTAQWCLICQTLERAVLYSDTVAGQLRPELGVVPMKIDLTNTTGNPAGVDLRNRMGFASIPLLVVLAPDGTEIFKSEAYTIDQVVEAIEQAKAAAGTKTAAVSP